MLMHWEYWGYVGLLLTTRILMPWGYWGYLGLLLTTANPDALGLLRLPSTTADDSQ